MPHCRKYKGKQERGEILSSTEARRRSRDDWYRSSAGHGPKHVRVPVEDVEDVRTVAKSMRRRREVNELNGASEPSLSAGAIRAHAGGLLSAGERNKEVALTKRRNTALHKDT